MSTQIEALQQFAATTLNLPEAETKPLVKLPGNGIQIRDTARSLYGLAASQGGLYYSNGSVVKLNQRDATSSSELITLSPAAAMSEFEKYARFEKAAKGIKTDGSETVLVEAMAKALLACDVAKDQLPNVKGLLNRPLPILHEGSIEVLHDGYNAKTGLLVAGGQLVEPDTVEQAVEMIEAILADFTFQTDADISRAIACFLTPALRIGGFIQGDTPIHIIEAEESQTGKGFFLKLRDLLYGEKSILIARQKGGVGSVDESFGKALLTGRPFIQFDNVRDKLSSEVLEAFLTNPATLLVRVPYSDSRPVDGSLRFVSITSNGLETTEDLANRASFIRLQKEKDRTFSMVNSLSIEELVQGTQGHLMGAITKIIRHFHEAGMPRTTENRHERKEWAQKLDWIVQNIFGLAPLMDNHQEVQKRSRTPDLSFVRAVAIQVEKLNLLGHSLKAQQIANLCETGAIEIPGLNKKSDNGYSDIQEAQRVGGLMGSAFGMNNEITVDSYRITRESRIALTGAGNSYTGRQYEFRRIDETAVETANVI
jgi:hypothetical protein